MTTIEQLRAMPVGTRIGGGFILTVKMTKKSVQLPNKKYVHTVVLCDETGEMVADFLGTEAYLPMKKGEQVKIIVAEIQELVLKEGNDGQKLVVSQWQVKTQTLDEYDAEIASYKTLWEKETRGKIRHGVVCSCIQRGMPLPEIIMSKTAIETVVEYIFDGTEEPKTTI